MTDTAQSIDLDWVTFSEEDHDEACESTKSLPDCPNQAVWRWVYLGTLPGFAPPTRPHTLLICDAHKEAYEVDEGSRVVVYRWERLSK